MRKIVFGVITFLILAALPAVSEGKKEHLETEPDPIRTYALIYPEYSPFYLDISNGAVFETGGTSIRLLIRGAESSVQPGQVEHMKNMIERKVDGIALWASGDPALIPLINRARDRGIHVVCFGQDMAESGRQVFLGQHERTLAGRRLGQKVLEKLNFGGSTVIALMGEKTGEILMDRMNGLKEVFKKTENIEVMTIVTSHNSRDSIIGELETILEQHVEADIFIVDSTTAPAAILLWKAMGLKTPLFAFGSDDDILVGIRDAIITGAVSYQQFLWGRKLIAVLDSLYFSEPVLEKIDFPVYYLTLESVESFIDKQYESPIDR